MEKRITFDQQFDAFKVSPEDIDESWEEILLLQQQLIHETETLTRRCFEKIKADLINFDAMQAICFLCIAEQHKLLNILELRNYLKLLGVHPLILRETVRILQREYHIPKSTDLLNFIKHIAPILFARTEYLEKV